MSAAPSSSKFTSYWQRGYRHLLPIIPPDAPISERSSLFKRIGTPQDARGKVPGIKGVDGKWHSYDWTQHEPDERDIDRYDRMGAGVGFRTSETFVGFDVDTLNDSWSALAMGELLNRFGPVAFRVGNKPKFLVPFRLSAPMQYTRIEFGDGDRIEILAAQRQFVGEGIHPKTRLPYVWSTPLPMFDQLPIVSPAEIQACLNALRACLPRSTNADQGRGHG
ncbi:hypothetical protein ACVWZL_001301 [Bradyrhizobium sp. GM2.4]